MYVSHSQCLCLASPMSKNNLWPWHHVTEYQTQTWFWDKQLGPKSHNHDHERQTDTLLVWKGMCLPCHSWVTIQLRESKAMLSSSHRKKKGLADSVADTHQHFWVNTPTHRVYHTPSLSCLPDSHTFCLWDWPQHRRRDTAHGIICLFKIGRGWSFLARLKVSVKYTEHSCLTVNTKHSWLRLSYRYGYSHKSYRQLQSHKSQECTWCHFKILSTNFISIIHFMN